MNLGRNIWQNDYPVAMIRALRAVIHENATPEQAFDIFQTVKAEFLADPAARHQAASPAPAGVAEDRVWN